MTIDTTRLRALTDAATPGPWAWYGDLTAHRIYLATVNGGRRFVMDFRRWGMSGAMPRFQVGGIMRTIKELATREAPYRDDIAEIDHPDARFIAAMDPTTVRALLDEVERLRAVAAQVPSDVEFFALRAVASEDPEDITDDESTLACEYVERVKHLRTKRPEEGSTR